MAVTVETKDAMQGAPANASEPRILLVTQDNRLAAQLQSEASSRGVQLHWIECADNVHLPLDPTPDVILIEISRDNESASHALLQHLADNPEHSMPVLVLSESDSLTDRVEIARLGASGFLQKPQRASAILDSVLTQLNDSRSSKGRVLVLDEKESAAHIRALLEHAGIQVRTLDDASEFWHQLEEYVPDLLILNAEQSMLNGSGICQAVRSDPRWEIVPIVFLTKNNDIETMNSVFANGGDDLIRRDNIDAQLLIRVRNRLTRTRSYTRLAETDPLTGLANRRKSTQAIARLMLLAERQHQPLCIATIDLDHFKTVNDTYGHAVGDVVLRRLGHLLLSSFRGEDVVARWGGEEMVVGIFGMNREDGVHRLAEVLDQFRSIVFSGGRGRSFSISFSAGVAEYPVDGPDLQSLYRIADKALYMAKTMGRSRVLPAHWVLPDTQVNQTCDLIVASPDEKLYAAVTQALGVRGYSTVHARVMRTVLEDMEKGSDFRAVLIDIDSMTTGEAIQLEHLLREKRYPAKQVVVMVPETRVLHVPVPDIADIRLIGRSFSDYELMRLLRQTWKNGRTVHR